MSQKTEIVTDTNDRDLMIRSMQDELNVLKEKVELLHEQERQSNEVIKKMEDAYSKVSSLIQDREEVGKLYLEHLDKLKDEVMKINANESDDKFEEEQITDCVNRLFRNLRTMITGMKDERSVYNDFKKTVKKHRMPTQIEILIRK